MALVGNYSFGGNWKPEWGDWKKISWQNMTPEQRSARVADDKAWRASTSRPANYMPNNAYSPYSFNTAYGDSVLGAINGGNFPDLFQPDLYSTSRSSSFSGLAKKYRKQIGNTLVPEMVQKATELPETIDKYTQNAADLYQRLSRRALEDAQGSILNNLANRNVLNSSVASDAISKSIKDIVPTFADRGYQAAMEGAKMQATVPSILGQLASLAKYSTASGSSQDPLEPYKLLSNFVMGF